MTHILYLNHYLVFAQNTCFCGWFISVSSKVKIWNRCPSSCRIEHSFVQWTPGCQWEPQLSFRHVVIFTLLYYRSRWCRYRSRSWSEADVPSSVTVIQDCWVSAARPILRRSVITVVYFYSIWNWKKDINFIIWPWRHLAHKCVWSVFLGQRWM